MEMRQGRAPVATLRGDELGAWEDIRQLGKNAEAWYRDNLVGTTVTMESTGWPIRFGRVGAKKLGGRKGDVLLRLVPALRDIIEKAELVGSDRGSKAGTERQTFHKVSAAVSLGGDQYPVIVTIREDANGKFHYDLSMDSTVSSGATDRVAEARNGQPDDNGDGARFMREGAETSITDNRYGLEDNPVDLNLEFSPAGIKSPAGWGEVEGDPPITEDDIRGITREMNAELERSGLAGKVNV